jgi:hypothetical protein
MQGDCHIGPHPPLSRPCTLCTASQEIFRPDIFWYDAATKTDSPFGILGLLAFEFWCMHFVEIKRWQDWHKPNSVNVDPLFPQNKIADHDVGYPGLKLFVVSIRAGGQGQEGGVKEMEEKVEASQSPSGQRALKVLRGTTYPWVAHTVLESRALHSLKRGTHVACDPESLIVGRSKHARGNERLNFS